MKLHRTNINLNEADVHYLETHFGTGWTARVRDKIHEWVQDLRRQQEERAKFMLGGSSGKR